MIYKYIFVVFILFMNFGLEAQTKNPNSSYQSYEQKINGTNLYFTMEAIPGGVFKMGSDQGDDDEVPVHDVKLDAFWMSTFEVTWDLFEPFLYKDYELTQSTESIPDKVDAITRPTKPYLDMTFGMGKVNHPALAMTQYNAIQFCKWLYARTGIFYRLPTEAEWEYAARAGQQKDYFFGDDAALLGQYAWYKSNSGDETHEVGHKKPNPWGLYDIYGNVAEWTYDQYINNYNAFENKLNVNPVVIPEQLYPHSIRGGSYIDEASDLRSAARLASDPVWKQIDPQIPKSNWWMPEASFIGIRLVRPAALPTKEDIEAYYNKQPIEDY